MALSVTRLGTRFPKPSLVRSFSGTQAPLDAYQQLSRAFILGEPGVSGCNQVFLQQYLK
jgi:hypothetical protein